MGKPQIVSTRKKGALRIDIRMYSDGRFGFDWQNDQGRRKQERCRLQGDAEARADELMQTSRAGKLDVLGVDPEKYKAFLRWEALNVRSCSVSEVVESFLEYKRSKGRSPKHLRGLAYNLNAFAKKFRCDIDALGRSEVERWLDSRGKRERIGPRRWNNLLADIIALVRFARRDGFVSADVSPVEKIERKAVAVHVHTYSPDELRKILLAVGSPWLPAVVLGAFCGIRPEEVAPERQHEKAGLTWENILWEKRKIDVPASVAKNRRRRFAPLTDAAISFLECMRGQRGPISPPSRFYVEIDRLRRQKKIQWKPDALRHSFASYRLAQTKDVAALALEMGNSPAMIFRHYLDLKHEDEAVAWFGITPANVASVTIVPESNIRTVNFASENGFPQTLSTRIVV